MNNYFWSILLCTAALCLACAGNKAGNSKPNAPNEASPFDDFDEASAVSADPGAFAEPEVPDGGESNEPASDSELDSDSPESNDIEVFGGDEPLDDEPLDDEPLDDEPLDDEPIGDDPTQPDSDDFQAEENSDD